MPNEHRIRGSTRFLRLPDQPVEKDVDEELAFDIDSRGKDLVGGAGGPGRGVAGGLISG